MDRLRQQVVHAPVAVVDEDVRRRRRPGRPRSPRSSRRPSARPRPGSARCPVGRVRVVDPGDPLHVDADVDPHGPPPRGRSVPGGRSRHARRRTAPPSRSAPAPWSRRWRSARPRMPHRDAARRADRDRRLAERHLADPVDDGQPVTPNRPSISSAIARGGDRAIDLVRLVVERLDRPAGMARRLGLLPGAGVPGVERVRPRNPTTAPSRGTASRSASSPRIAASNGASRSSRIGPGAPCAAPPETGGIIATSSPSARTVAGSA